MVLGDREVIDQEIPVSLQAPTMTSTTVTTSISSQSMASIPSTSQSSVNNTQTVQSTVTPLTSAQTNESAQYSATTSQASGTSSSTSQLNTDSQSNSQSGTVRNHAISNTQTSTTPAKALRSVIRELSEEVNGRLEEARREMADREFENFVKESKKGPTHHHSSDDDSEVGVRSKEFRKTSVLVKV